MSKKSHLGTYARTLRGLLPEALRPGSGQAAYPTRTVRTTHEVSGDTVAAFDSVIQSPLRDTVPPGFLHCLSFAPSLELMTEPGFPIPVLGMVHVRNRFTQITPVRIGQTVDVDVSLSELHSVKNGVEVDIQVTGSVAGETVFEETSTYLAKGKSVPRARPVADAQRLSFPDDLEPTALWRLARSVGPEYARVSGDYNPIHVNVLAAKAFGFPQTIAHGMYSASRALAAVDTTWESFVWEVQFASPLILPATSGFAAFTRSEERVETAVFNPRKHKPHVLTRLTRRG